MIGGIAFLLDDVELVGVGGKEGDELLGGLGGSGVFLVFVDVGPERGIGETGEEGLAVEGGVEGDDAAVGAFEGCGGRGGEGGREVGFLEEWVVLLHGI